MNNSLLLYCIKILLEGKTFSFWYRKQKKVYILNKSFFCNIVYIMNNSLLLYCNKLLPERKTFSFWYRKHQKIT